MLLEIITPAGTVTTREHMRTYEVLIMCFLVWVLVTHIFSLCRNLYQNFQVWFYFINITGFQSTSDYFIIQSPYRPFICWFFVFYFFVCLLLFRFVLDTVYEKINKNNLITRVTLFSSTYAFFLLLLLSIQGH